MSTRLGLTSFGGPIAHLGYFRAEYVERRHWLDEATYADLVALWQFMPGPTSSQVGFSIGLLRAGVPGGVVAWLGFTLPSVIALVLFAFGLQAVNLEHAGWLHGLKLVAVAVVAQAVWGMARTLAPDRPRATIAILTALAVLWRQTALMQVGAIAIAAVVGWRLFPMGDSAGPDVLRIRIARWLVVGAWVLFFGLLLGLPVARQLVDWQPLALFDSFYRTGALVFGGGHVVLPLLRAEVVPPGWVDNDQFLAGYGAAQAVPGPLLTFAAYLGAVMQPAPNGWLGALIAVVAIFLPSFFLLVGVLPFWDMLRRRGSIQAMFRGVNAAVVGILGAALYTPIWTSAVHRPADFALALAAFGLLQVWRLPPWLVVIFAAVGGQALAMF
ncbi:MAG: chromate efflux transporter [Dehalococcoidia bacterium]